MDENESAICGQKIAPIQTVQANFKVGSSGVYALVYELGAPGIGEGSVRLCHPIAGSSRPVRLARVRGANSGGKTRTVTPSLVPETVSAVQHFPRQ